MTGYNLLVSPATGQIIPDSTLGAESSVVTPNTDINGIPSTQIDGGAIRGTNLFHSFREFNIDSGQGAYFSNPAGIQTILSRVTGSNPSNIQGTLGVLGNANLFFLNPNGIVFGPNSRLDVRGSFVATTADSLGFDNGWEFSATNPSLPPLLTINIPVGLHYRTQQPGAIINAENLAVQPGQNITLVGGTVVATGQLQAPGGQISLLAVPGESVVQLGQDGRLLSVSPATNPESTTPLAPSLAELLNTTDYDTGLAVTSDGQVELQNSGTRVDGDVGTVIVSGTLDASNPAAGQTGGTVQVLGSRVGLFDTAAVNVSGEAGGGTALMGGNYQGQGILPNALATYIGRDVTINADASGAGNGGQIVVWANDSTRAYGTLSARGGAVLGNGGLIETSSLNFLDISGIKVDATAAQGLSGTWLIDPRNITIQDANGANGTFSGDNPNVFAPVGDNSVVSTQDIQAQLNAGTNVTITTGSTGTQEGNITVADSIIKTSGGAATLTLQAANHLTFESDVNISSNSDALNLVLTADSDHSGSGDIVMTNGQVNANGGQITITASSISLVDRAQIRSETEGSGNPGQITLTADDSISLRNNSGIFSRTEGTSDAGAITLTARSISIENQGSGLSSDTRGIGNGGAVILNADSVTIRGSSGIGTDTFGSGNAGEILITAESLLIENQSGLGTNAQAFSSGNAGEILINADSILIQNQSGFGSDTFGSGNAGEITINADSLTIRNQSGAGTHTNSEGNAGQMNINVGSMVLEDRSGLGSDARANSSGNAGIITIVADSLVIQNDAGIGSSSLSSGKAGQINIMANSALLQLSELTSQSSSSGSGGNLLLQVGEFTVQDQAVIAVNSSGSGDAGSLEIRGDSLQLDNGSTINASTVEGMGGNILLNVSTLQLRRGSNITTDATSANGGNIMIETDVLSALENSDISANSRDFRGGNVTVNAQGVFGTQFRDTLTPESDITASGRDSSFTGNVTINTPGVDPSRGLASLPVEVVDPAAIIAQNPCELGKGSGFVVSGRGGLPPNPSDALSRDAVRVGLVEPAESTENTSAQMSSPPPHATANRIVPAQGWVFNEKGEVILTAYNPTITESQRPWTNSIACYAP
jgi:filamentous hemagglutinin family protein